MNTDKIFTRIMLRNESKEIGYRILTPCLSKDKKYVFCGICGADMGHDSLRGFEEYIKHYEEKHPFWLENERKRRNERLAKNK